MGKVTLVSQFIIILVAAIISICVGLNYHVDKSYQYQQDSVSSAKIVRSSSRAEPIESFLVADTKLSSATLPTYKTTSAFEQYKPRYAMATIHSSNYGERYSTDIYGNPVSNLPLVVLHETTNSVASAINTFQTPHASDRNQVSYHALISLDGTVIYLLSAAKRAFGAGNSAFVSPTGIETVKTNPDLPPSVNNFAYHISLETPPDGRGRASQSYHSGYTDNQYKSLAWLIAQSSIPDDRITTHKDVDRSGQRIDPRNFDFDKFLGILRSYRQPTVDKTSVN